MDELLTAEQAQLRDSAARLCRELGGAKRARELREAGRELDDRAWDAMRAAGWLATMVPEEKAGLGLGTVEFYVIAEQIGRHALTVPLTEAMATAWLLGRAPGGEEALNALLAGTRLVLPAFAGDGWDFHAHGAAIVGHRRGNAITVEGTVRHVPFAEAATDLLVRIDLDGEIVVGAMPRANDTCSVSSRRNVDGSTGSTVALAGALLEPARIVARGPAAQALAAKAADLLALGAAIELLGLSEAALAMTLEHIKTRRQFGRALGSFQALQHRVVDGFAALELDRALLYRICLEWDRGVAQPAILAAAKARAARSAAEVMRTALQLHGAMGYTDEHDIGVLFKRALVLAARYGNELAQSERFARLTAEEA